jgi:hypothetical protein
MGFSLGSAQAIYVHVGFLQCADHGRPPAGIQSLLTRAQAFFNGDIMSLKNRQTVVRLPFSPKVSRRDTMSFNGCVIIQSRRARYGPIASGLAREGDRAERRRPGVGVCGLFRSDVFCAVILGVTTEGE